MKRAPTALVILDGFGYRKETAFNAIACANTPHLKSWFTIYPHVLLAASGTAVGLPKGTIGNSEVGHITIGSGRIIPQPITIINNSIDTGLFFQHPLLRNNLSLLAQKGTKLHVIGLLSDGNVHSNIDHLFAYLHIAHHYPDIPVYIHAFLDGRDVPPQSACTYLKQLAQVMNTLDCGSLGSIHGRFYAMDRDHHWKRTQQSYNILTQKQPPSFATAYDALDYYYTRNITDEFIPPTQLDSKSIIQRGDGIIFFNIRPERAQQLTRCFVDSTFDHFPITPIPLSFFITPIAYHDTLKTDTLLKKSTITNTLKQVLSDNHFTIFSIAETEKYAHVTYFFSGGREKPFPYETHHLIPSLPKKNYINHPEMSALAITQTVIASLKKEPCNFYLINYANADMVGHSGNFDATVQAIECLDTQLALLYKIIVKELKGTIYITSDHGNAEEMYDSHIQQVLTRHTTNPVPFLVLSPHIHQKTLALHQLADIAPFILKHMNVPIPQEMIHENVGT